MTIAVAMLTCDCVRACVCAPEVLSTHFAPIACTQLIASVIFAVINYMSDNMMQVVMVAAAPLHPPLYYDADADTRMCMCVVVLGHALRFVHGQRKIRQCSNFCACHTHSVSQTSRETDSQMHR